MKRAISSSTSYLSRSPKRFLYPLASWRSLRSKVASSKISWTRTPLRAALVLYEGPMPRPVVPILRAPSCRVSAGSRGGEHSAHLDFLEAVDGGVEVKVDLAAVGDQDAVVGLEALLFQLGKLLEEAGDVEDDAGADQVDAVGVDQAGRKKVEADGSVSGRRSGLGRIARIPVRDSIRPASPSVFVVAREVSQQRRKLTQWSVQRCGRPVRRSQQQSQDRGRRLSLQRLWRKGAPRGRGCR